MATQTKHQPLVLVVKAERDFSNDELDPDSDAFTGLLRIMHGCSSSFFRHTLCLSDWLEEEQSKMIVPSQVVALIIHEEKDDWDITSEILLLRKEHSFIKNVPTIVIPHYKSSIPLLKTASFLNGHINKADDLNSEIIDLVGRLVTEWVATRDWLGIDYMERCPEMLDVLEDVYLQNQDDSNYSVPVDQNHMVVAEALRIKLLSGELVGKRYDEAFEKKYTKPEKESSSLISDLKKIREMFDEEKSSFFSEMLRTQGTVGGLGPKVSGFAIDAVTLESLIVGFGRHGYVNSLLKDRLESMNMIRGRKPFNDGGSPWRLFNGSIYKSAPGVETSILKMYFSEEVILDTPQRTADMERILDFLKNQKKFIIINSHYQLL